MFQRLMRRLLFWRRPKVEYVFVAAEQREGQRKKPRFFVGGREI